MITQMAACDRCGREVQAETSLWGSADYPDGWASLYEKRKISLEERLKERVNLTICPTCLFDVVGFIRRTKRDEK